MRSLSSFLISMTLVSCGAAHESKELSAEDVPVDEASVPESAAGIEGVDETSTPPSEIESLELVEEEASVTQSVAEEALESELALLDQELEEELAEDEPDVRVQYSQRTEIDLEGLDVSGELVKPQGELLLDRRSQCEDSRLFLCGGPAPVGSKGANRVSDLAPAVVVPSANLPSFAESSPGMGTRGRGMGRLGYGSGGGGIGSASRVGSIGSTGSVTVPTENLSTSMGANQFTDHGVNPFTLVEDDALSTFSIDVDTASYSISRRFLNSGQLPPFQSVRVEEFVNALNYDYPPPEEEVFSVHMEAMPDPFRDGNHILRVGIKAKEVEATERDPVHLTFLVDVSGSMGNPYKLELAKSSMKLLVNQLNEDDTVAIATYASGSRKVLAPTVVSKDWKIHSAIDRLHANGSTGMSGGLDLAYSMADESFVAGRENRVLVLSDGDANVGATSWDQMLDQIKGYADKGVTLTTIGFGMGNYHDTRMEQLADHGEGQAVYIDGEAEAQRLFVDELSGTLSTVARDTKIQVEFNPASVRAYRLIGYENRDIADADFRDDRVDAGEVGASHDVTALYQVILSDDYERDLASVRIRWERPGPDGEATERTFKMSSRTMKESTEFASSDLRMAYASATFAEVLRQSPHASEVSLSALTHFARDASRPGEKDHLELVKLMVKAEHLGAGQKGLAEN